MGAFGQHCFNQVDGEDARHLPRCQGQLGEGGGVFQHVQKTLHRRIIVAYAVAQA
jgi:hypothetical protein